MNFKKHKHAHNHDDSPNLKNCSHQSHSEGYQQVDLPSRLHSYLDAVGVPITR